MIDRNALYFGFFSRAALASSTLANFFALVAHHNTPYVLDKLTKQGGLKTLFEASSYQLHQPEGPVYLSLAGIFASAALYAAHKPIEHYYESKAKSQTQDRFFLPKRPKNHYLGLMTLGIFGTGLAATTLEVSENAIKDMYHEARWPKAYREGLVQQEHTQEDSAPADFMKEWARLEA